MQGVSGIGDYFLIGDLHSAALVNDCGSIDWLCWPHFDSPSLFARLLDERAGGTFAFDLPRAQTHAAYQQQTAIVDTHFHLPDYDFTVSDFMVPQEKSRDVSHFLVRKIHGTRGEGTVRLLFDPRPDYARAQAEITHQGNTLLMPLQERFLHLHLPPDTHVEHQADGAMYLELSIREGAEVRFVLELSHTPTAHTPSENHPEFEIQTQTFWRTWVAQGTFSDFCRDRLIRNAITLKLMQFYPTGGIVAAPTTSLPEEIGGGRNWDYRYVWIRDATFTLYGLYLLGYTQEAQQFFAFIESIAESSEQCDLTLDIFYTLAGHPVPKEETLNHLRGYRDSSPVRIGNGARDQLQFDVYGSLIDAYYFMFRKGIPITPAGKRLIRSLARQIEHHYEHKDNSIWEVRGGAQHFTYSKVLCWVGINRVLRLADELGLSDEERDHYTRLQEKIRAYIWQHCYDPKRGTFRQHAETNAQDATNFLFVLLQFLDRKDPRTTSIIERTCEELLQEPVFVARYKNDDGLSGGESAFILCGFWLIAALSEVGQLDRAQAMFDSFESLIPESGLLAEEIMSDGTFLGNFPQAFSHIGSILAARYLEKNLRKREAETHRA